MLLFFFPIPSPPSIPLSLFYSLYIFPSPLLVFTSLPSLCPSCDLFYPVVLRLKLTLFAFRRTFTLAPLGVFFFFPLSARFFLICYSPPALTVLPAVPNAE